MWIQFSFAHFVSFYKIQLLEDNSVNLNLFFTLAIKVFQVTVMKIFEVNNVSLLIKLSLLKSIWLILKSIL